MGKSRWRVLLLVAIPCSVSLWAGFFIDDYVIIEIARNTRWGVDLIDSNFDICATSLLDGWLPEFLARFHLNFFRPGIIALFKIDWMLYGLNPAGYHLTNVLLHLLMVYSVIKLVRPWTGNDRDARLAGLLFGLMPHSIGAVVWLAGRTSILAALLVVWCYLFFRRYHASGSRWAGLGSLLALVGALACKETGLIAPFLIAACMPKRPWTKPLFWMLLAVVALYLGGRATIWGWGTYHGPSILNAPEGWPGRIRFAWLKAVEIYLSLALQVPHYHILHIKAMESPGLFAGISTAGLLLGFVMWRRLRTHPAGWWMLAWCGLSCAITFPVPPMAHYLYLAQAGIALTFVLFWRAEPRDRPWRIHAGLGAWWLLLVAGTLCYVLAGVLSRAQADMVTGARERMAQVAEDLEPGGTLALVDLHIFQIHLGPAFRVRTGRDDVKLVVLNPANGFVQPQPSRIETVDEHTVRLQAVGRPYLTDIVAKYLLLDVEAPDWMPGMGVECADPAYRLSVGRVGPPRESRQRGLAEIEAHFADPIDGRRVAIVRCLEPGDMDDWLLRWMAGLGGGSSHRVED